MGTTATTSAISGTNSPLLAHESGTERQAELISVGESLAQRGRVSETSTGTKTSAIIAADSPAESKSLQAFGALQRVAAGQGAACIAQSGERQVERPGDLRPVGVSLELYCIDRFR